MPTIFLCSQVVGTDRPFWWTVKGIDREVLKRVPNHERLSRLAAIGVQNGERRALSQTELRALAGRVKFGARACTRPADVHRRGAEREIVDCKAEIEELTD